MTENQAYKQACKESGMHRQGNQWVVTTWDESVKAWRDVQTVERGY